MKILESTIPELREKAMKIIMGHIKHAIFFNTNRRYDRWESIPSYILVTD